MDRVLLGGKALFGWGLMLGGVWSGRGLELGWGLERATPEEGREPVAGVARQCPRPHWLYRPAGEQQQ